MMLDKFSLDCPYKKDGCTRTVTRYFNLDHIESCFYNTKMFGPLVMACKTLGFHNCTFKINRGNTHQFVQHLRYSHFVTSLLNEKSLEVDFTDFDKFVGGRRIIILTLQDEGYAFLILVTHKPEQGLGWTAFYLRYIKNTKPGTSKEVEPAHPPLAYKLECIIKGRPPLTWSVFPEDILACDGVPEHFNWGQADLVPVPGEGSPSSLTAYVNVRKMASVTSQDANSMGTESTLILTPFSMPIPATPVKESGEEGEVLLCPQPTSPTPMRTCPYDKLSEHLKCPICKKVPKGKVFQCKEGHLLCEECHPELGTCAECHVMLPLPPFRIRALIVETMLDELTLECPYQKSGCDETMNRKCLQDHMDSCCYNVTRFGPFVSICEGLGLGKCPFKMNRGSTTQSICHLEEVHEATVHDSSYLEIEFADFANFPRSCTKPLIMNRKEDGYAYLILMTPDEEGMLTWAVYYLRYPKPSHSSELELVLPPVPHKIECSLNGRCSLSWGGALPVDIFANWISKACKNDAGQMSMDPTRCFNSPLTSVFAMVKVTKVDREEVKDQDGSHITLTPSSMQHILLPATVQQALPNLDKTVEKVEKESGSSKVMGGDEVAQPLDKERTCAIGDFKTGRKISRRMSAPCFTDGLYDSEGGSPTKIRKLETEKTSSSKPSPSASNSSSLGTRVSVMWHVHEFYMT